MNLSENPIERVWEHLRPLAHLQKLKAEVDGEQMSKALKALTNSRIVAPYDSLYVL